MGFGSKIAEARKNNNMTQEQLAELLSVTRQTISRWESEQSYPEMDRMIMLSEILGISCDYLLNDSCSAAPSAQAPGYTVTRLLKSVKGKKVKLTLYNDWEDTDLQGMVCRITEFDGQWMHVEYQKKKKPETKLIPVSSVLSITILGEGREEDVCREARTGGRT